MESVFELGQELSLKMARNRGSNNNLNCINPVFCEHWRKGRLLNVYKGFNDITNVGKNYLFNAGFNNGTVIANNSWFIGLITNSGYSALNNADTMSSHAGWAEATGYSQSTRVAWGSGTATAQSTSNASAAVFNMTGTDTIKGVFITSVSTISGTTGTLWATALFGADVPVTNGDQLNITYTISA